MGEKNAVIKAALHSINFFPEILACDPIAFGNLFNFISYQDLILHFLEELNYILLKIAVGMYFYIFAKNYQKKIQQYKLYTFFVVDQYMISLPNGGSANDETAYASPPFYN